MTDEKRQARVMRLFFGTRADLAPHVMTYVWNCECCHEPTFSEAKPPTDQHRVCHICASQLTKLMEKQSNTRTVWNITEEGWDSIGELATEKQRPVEDVFKDVMEWQVRRPIKGEIFRRPEKKVKE
jgi:hypothetical protein